MCYSVLYRKTTKEKGSDPSLPTARWTDYFFIRVKLSVALRYQAQLFSNAKEAFTIQLI